MTVQQAINNCVSGTALNPSACGTLVRNPASAPGGGQATQPFGLVDFIQSSINYAALEAKGIDFLVRYSLDLADTIGGMGRLTGGAGNS